MLGFEFMFATNIEHGIFLYANVDSQKIGSAPNAAIINVFANPGPQHG